MKQLKENGLEKNGRNPEQNIDISAVVEHLREYRRRYHLTQQDVADYLGVQRSTYARYEEGTNRPNFKVLIRLADLYGISVDALLGRQTADRELDELKRLLQTNREFQDKEFYHLYINANEYARQTALLILRSGQNGSGVSAMDKGNKDAG